MTRVHRVSSFKELLEKLGHDPGCFRFSTGFLGIPHFLPDYSTAHFATAVHLLDELGCGYPLAHLVQEVFNFNIDWPADYV